MEMLNIIEVTVKVSCPVPSRIHLPMHQKCLSVGLCPIRVNCDYLTVKLCLLILCLKFSRGHLTKDGHIVICLPIVNWPPIVNSSTVALFLMESSCFSRCFGMPVGAWELVGYPFERSGHRSDNSFNSKYSSAGRMICDCFDTDEGCLQSGRCCQDIPYNNLWRKLYITLSLKLLCQVWSMIKFNSHFCLYDVRRY